MRYGESRFDELDQRGFKVEFVSDAEGSNQPPPRASPHSAWMEKGPRGQSGFG